MRLTEVLFRINMIRHFQRIWKKEGKMETQEIKIPTELKEMGVPIKDAKDILLETQLFPSAVKKPFSIPMPPSVLNIPKCFCIMHNKTKVSENEKQTLSLTKTIPYQGLPEQVSSLIGLDSLPNQDEMVKTSILQSQIWDGEQYILPKLHDETRPHYNFRRVYGITHQKRVFGLQEKLAYLCDLATGKYASCLLRSKIMDAFSETSMDRNGDSVTFQMQCQIAVTSHEPLPRIATQSEVVETEQQEVPNIFPIKSTLDLDKVEERPQCAPLLKFNNRYLHTLFLSNPSSECWLPEQNLATAIGTCFSFCAKEAQMMYGADVKELPKPIVVQCAYMNVNTFNFMVYQLNTLDLAHNNGIKNQVWVDEPAPLYKEANDTSFVVEYNSDVFPKLLAFYSNGLHPSSL